MKVTVIGNKENIYINPTNNNALVDYKQAANFTSVNMLGVNHLVISRDNNGEMRIIQACGYNAKRGIFNDLY